MSSVPLHCRRDLKVFRALRRAVAVVLASLSAFSALRAEELVIQEDLSAVYFRGAEVELDSELRPYIRLSRGEVATALFCGQGRLQIRSRAVLPEATAKARYTLDLRLDGERTPRELAYRSYPLEGAYFEDPGEGRMAASSMRRTRIDLGRGCHDVEISLAHSTVAAVGVRLSFNPKKTTKRPFRDITPTGGRAVDVVVKGKHTPYHAIEATQVAELTVEGPAWVRLLARPMSLDEPSEYGVVITEDERPFRSYRLANTPSRRARLEGRRGVRLGAANEVVFAVGPGSRNLLLRSGTDSGLALRAQVVERDPSRRAAGEEPAQWSTRARVSSYYDSNILRYSDKFIQRFEEGRDPDRFRVESLDDVVQRADLDIQREFTGLARKRARFSLGLTHRSYWRNSIKDWTQGRVQWRQDLRRGRRLTLFVNMATDFYVRHIRDGDLVFRGSTSDPFQAFEFEKNEAGARFSKELGASWTASFDLSYATFRHSQAFTEFDSDNIKGRLRLDQQLTRDLRFSYAVEYTDSEAQGFDEPGETLETSDDTDPSYRQVDLMAALRYELPSARRQVLFLQAEVGEREYTTSKSELLAPFHNGREDEFLRLFASWQIDLNDRYRLSLFGQLRERDSSIPEDLDIGDEKNYSQYEMGLRVSARFD